MYKKFQSAEKGTATRYPMVLTEGGQQWAVMQREISRIVLEGQNLFAEVKLRVRPVKDNRHPRRS